MVTSTTRFSCLEFRGGDLDFLDERSNGLCGYKFSGFVASQLQIFLTGSGLGS